MAILIKSTQASKNIKQDIQNAVKSMHRKLRRVIFCSVIINIVSIGYIIFKLRIT